MKGDRSKRLQKKRSELIERSFAHVCETGGARRTWLRGLENVNKRYTIVTAARNLGLIMRRLFCLETHSFCWTTSSQNLNSKHVWFLKKQGWYREIADT